MNRTMSRRYLAIAITVIAAFTLFGVLLVSLRQEQASVIPSTVSASASAQYGGARVPYATFMEVEQLEADGWYVLVDLDEASFPHIRTNSITLKQLQHSGVLSNATQWDIHFGVVITTGSTLSQVEWIHTLHRNRTTQFHSAYTLPDYGLSLLVDTNQDDLMFVATSAISYTAVITEDTIVTSPLTKAGVLTTTAEAGDLIMWVDEVEAGGYLEHLSVLVSYDSQ